MNIRRIALLLLTAAITTVTQAQTAVRAEYFIDTDPGYGKAWSVTGGELGCKDYAIPLNGVSAGSHILYIRCSDSDGRWSSTVSHPLYVQPYRGFWKMEYFYDDADPGTGNATPLPRPEFSIGELLCDLPTVGLSLGSHTVSVRGLRQDGSWCDVVTRPFMVLEHMVPTVPGNLECFVDTDPGYGLGMSVAATTGVNHLAIELGNVAPGAHILYVRSFDEQGRWSTTVSRPLYVCPVVNITVLEYFFDQEDPGAGNGVQVPLSGKKSGEVSFEVDVQGLAAGQHQLNVRTKDDLGRWSLVSSEPFTLTKNQTGIKEVVADFAFQIGLSRSLCTVTPAGSNSRNDCRIEIFDATGRSVAKATWSAATPQITLPVGAQPGTVLIVKIQDVKDGRQMTRRFLMK